jgi:hypothetical protein
MLSAGYLLASSLSKVIEHKFIYYENTYVVIFSFFRDQSNVNSLPDEMENIYGFFFLAPLSQDVNTNGEKNCETKSKASVINCSSSNASQFKELIDFASGELTGDCFDSHHQEENVFNLLTFTVIKCYLICALKLVSDIR